MGVDKPLLSILSDPSLASIERNADRVLETIGIHCAGLERVEQLWRDRGARIENGCIKLPAGAAREIITRSAPSTFRQRARRDGFSVEFGKGAGVCAPASFTPFILDAGDHRRYTTTADLAVLAHLVQESPGLAHAGSLCEVGDVPVPARHLHHMATLFRSTCKPFLGPKPSVQAFADTLALAAIVFGEEVTGRQCCFLNVINPDSPLRYDSGVLEALCYSARTGQATLVTSWLVLGMTAPTTIADALAQALAEVLFGLATAQLVNPGAPVMAGLVAVPFSMKTMRPDCGSPSTWLMSIGAGQLCRRLGVPFRCDGGFTSAKCVDAQAGAESSRSLQIALNAGADFVCHAAGWLDNGLVVSAEKLRLDNASLLQISRAQAHADDRFDSPRYTPLEETTERALNEFVQARSEELIARERETR